MQSLLQSSSFLSTTWTCDPVVQTRLRRSSVRYCKYRSFCYGTVGGRFALRCFNADRVVQCYWIGGGTVSLLCKAMPADKEKQQWSGTLCVPFATREERNCPYNTIQCTAMQRSNQEAWKRQTQQKVLKLLLLPFSSMHPGQKKRIESRPAVQQGLWLLYHATPPKCQRRQVESGVSTTLAGECQ